VMWQICCCLQVDGSNSEARLQTMGNETTGKKVRPADEIIAAFDREQKEADELRRQHTERVRAARANDRQVPPVRKPRQK
jgi:hypothetical protein